MQNIIHRYVIFSLPFTEVAKNDLILDPEFFSVYFARGSGSGPGYVRKTPSSLRCKGHWTHGKPWQTSDDLIVDSRSLLENTGGTVMHDSGVTTVAGNFLTQP